jgi:hypothetical protein
MKSFAATLVALGSCPSYFFWIDAFSPQAQCRHVSTRSYASSLDIDLANLEEEQPVDSSSGGRSSNDDGLADATLPDTMLTLPRHPNEEVNEILVETENLLKEMHKFASTNPESADGGSAGLAANETIFANTYVDLGKVDTVGFDYDYTLVTYTVELLELIYDMALKRLVNDRQYPEEMLSAGLRYDPFFSIRGLAVDRETGWICHLSYTHKVAVAWEGREKLPTSRIYKEYRGKRALTPGERKGRLKPLNDLFSMAECCLIADTIQFFKGKDIDFCPNNVVTDILGVIGDTHISGDFHRMVAADPQKYFDPTPHLKSVLENLKGSGKRLIFAR